MALNGADIPSILARHTAAHGSEVIFRKKDRGIWKPVTWTDLSAHVAQIAVGLQQAGFGPNQVAGVLSQTRPEAAYADLAILSAGGTSLAIHPDEEPDRLAHIVRSTACRLLFVESEEQLDKTLTVRDRCPALQRIVIFDMKGLREFSDPQCSSLAGFHASGPAPNPTITPATKALILYPLTDKGPPTVLDYGDIARLLTSAGASLGFRAGDERLAVLAMNTLTEHVLGLYLSLQSRTITNYLESPETAVENLQEVQPTVFGADAEAWSGLHERISRRVAAATTLQGSLYRWAAGPGQHGFSGLAHLLVLNAIRRELGLNKLRLAFVCGEPVAHDVLAWARAMGIEIRQVDRPAPRGEVDLRSQAQLQEAYNGN